MVEVECLFHEAGCGGKIKISMLIWNQACGCISLVTRLADAFDENDDGLL